MANVVKLKNGSGSDPQASDLVVGEVAVRTDTAKLFTKKDNGSVAEIGASVGTDAVDTNAIQNDAVTLQKIQNISTSRILGRISSGGGDTQELTAANVRTLINVENGATADQSNSEIKTAYEANSNTNAFTDALLSKLNGIAASATNVTNNNQLTNGAGYITATLTNEQVQDIVGAMVSGNTESGITVTYQDGDGTLDFSVASQTDNNFTNADHSKLDGIEAGATADQTASEILTLIKTVDGAGSGLDADTLDGISSANFLRSNAADVMSQGTQGTATLDVRNTGGAGSGTGTGALIARFQGDSDFIEIRNIGGGDYGIYNSQQDNGLELYDGTGGVRVLYNGSIGVAFDSTNAYGDFKGVPSVNGTDLARVSDNITGTSAGFTAGNASNLNSGTVPQARLSASTLLTLIKTVDGSGSGLDADTLDGISSASFVRSDADDTLSGQYTISDSADEKLKLSGSNSPFIRFQEGTSNKAYIRWNAGGYIELVNQETAEALRIQSGVHGLKFVEGGNTRNVYHTGNLTVGDGGLTENNFTDADHSKLNGIASGATNVTNNNQLTNGAGYITSSNSAITNKLPLAGGTMTGELQINARLDVGTGSGNDHEIRIYKGDNNVSDHIQFYNGTTRVGEIGCEDTTWLRINQETAKNIYTPRYIRADAGFFVDGTSKGINGSGNFIGGTIAGASDYSTLLRSNTADTASGLITFNGGISVNGKAAANIVSVSDGSTITLNMNSGTHHAVTLGGNRTFAAPSNQNVGQSGSIFITQDGTGSRTATFNSAFKFVGGSAPTLSTAANAVDRIDYVIRSSNVIHCAFSADVK